MKKIISVFLAAMLVFALCACGAGGESADFAGDMLTGSAPNSSNKVELKDQDEGLYFETSDSITSVDSQIYSDPDAKIIRSAVLTIQTVDFSQSVEKLAALTELNGGYYETAKVSGGGYYDTYANRSAYYVVRIPKENFVAFRDAVGAVGHIYSISEGAKNVGEVYHDTEMRLATLETKQERLLALLEEAYLMEDIISLENALAEVQYEIDSLNTTLRKYDSLIDYSTFEIDLHEVVKIEEEPGVQDSFGTKLIAQLKNGWNSFTNGILNFVLWFARNIISLVIVAAVIFAFVRVVIYWRRKRRNNNQL